MTLPEGIPTYTWRHGKYVWPVGRGPALLLLEDFDVFWVTAGEMSMELESGPTLIARRGEILLLPPLVAGTLRQHSGRVVFWFCHFAFRAAGGRGSQRSVNVPMKLRKSEAEQVRSAYARVNQLLEDGGQNGWLREAAMIQLVAALAEKGVPVEGAGRNLATVSPRHDPRVAQLRQRIENDPAAEWRVSELARSVDLSTGHLHALWARALQSSVKGYIVKARLRLAMERMRARTNGQAPSIKQVAASCGFSSQHLFCRQFRQVFGITPSAFRDSAGL